MLSVVLPTHNRADILHYFLDSLAEVRLPKQDAVEFLFIANGCKDNTVEVLNQFRQSNKRFNVRVMDESKSGLSFARNRGLELAQYPFVAFLDDDIKIDAGWVESAINLIKTKEFDILGGKIELFWVDCCQPLWFERHELRLLGWNDHGDSFLSEANRSHVFGGNFIVRKSLIEEIGNFSETYGRIGTKKGAGEESDFVTRASNFGKKICYSPAPIIHHMVTPERIKLDFLLRVAFGAGQARAQLSGTAGYKLKAKKLAEIAKILITRMPQNPRHAAVLTYDRLGELTAIK